MMVSSFSPKSPLHWPVLKSSNMFSRFLPMVSALLVVPFGALAQAPIPTTVLLSGGPNPAPFGQPVSLTASVMPPAASGKVTFYDGVTILGTKQLANGSATMTTSLLVAGRRSLWAYYAGDAAFAPGSSTPAPLLVQTISGNSFQVCPQSKWVCP